MKPRGLPPSARLHSRADFARIHQSRDHVGGRYFRLRHAPGVSPWPRLGLAVSRKVSKRAIDRNRIKRCVRASFRAVRTGLPPRDILVIARPQAAAADNAALRGDLDALWSRLARLNRVDTDATIAR